MPALRPPRALPVLSLQLGKCDSKGHPCGSIPTAWLSQPRDALGCQRPRPRPRQRCAGRGRGRHSPARGSTRKCPLPCAVPTSLCREPLCNPEPPRAVRADCGSVSDVSRTRPCLLGCHLAGAALPIHRTPTRPRACARPPGIPAWLAFRPPLGLCSNAVSCKQRPLPSGSD